MIGAPHHVYIDSDYALSGDCGNFNYAFNLPKNRVFDSVAVLQASIPKSYYVVREGLNTIVLTEGASSVTITITAGNYSMESFRVTLQAALNSNSPHSWVYTITRPTVTTAVSTGKYTFGVTGNTSQPSLYFPAQSLLYKQCGFNWNSTNTFVAGSIVSRNVVNFNTVQAVIIKSDMIEGSGTNSVHGASVLQEVYSFNVYDYSTIGFQTTDSITNAKKLKANDFTIANFTITDLDDQIIDFNGQSMNMSLLFFKRSTYDEMALLDLKMRYYQDLTAKQQPTTQPPEQKQ